MRSDCSTFTGTFMRRSLLARHTAPLLALSTLLAPAVGAQQAAERPTARPEPRPLGAAIATSAVSATYWCVRRSVTAMPGRRRARVAIARPSPIDALTSTIAMIPAARAAIHQP